MNKEREVLVMVWKLKDFYLNKDNYINNFYSNSYKSHMIIRGL